MNKVYIYIRILIVILLLGITSSCAYDETIYGGDSDSNVTLTLTLGDQVPGSRATEAGNDNFNENVIKSVELFFYAYASSDTDAPVYTTSIILPDGIKRSATLTPTIPADKVLELFPADGSVTECKVYAIVNRPTGNDQDIDNEVLLDNELPANKSIASLKKNVVLYADFVATDNSGVQASFVMDGEATLNRTDAGLSGTIQVERVAAKVSLIIDKIEPVMIDGVEWTQTGEVKISFMNSSTRTKLGFSPNLEGYVYEPRASDLLDMENITLTKSGDSWLHNVPFYTYPINWKKSESTHIILTVQWTHTGATKPTTTFYSLNVNPGASYTERNHYYKITQEISVLGSTTVEEAIPLEPSYQVLEWGEDQLSSANLDRFRYLVVDETSVTMKNIVTKKIYFDSSAPIYLKNAKVDWDNTSGNLAVFEPQASSTYNTPTVSSNNGNNPYLEYNLEGERLSIREGVDYEVYITIHNADEEDLENYILVEHELDNSMDKDADYSRYQMELVVAHQDNTLTETIKITQYPMMCIEADQNSDYTNGDGVNDDEGFVIVNKTSATGWSGVNGMVQSQNPNRYIVSISSLDVGSTYIIGDPRTKYVSNPSGMNTDAYGRSLTYYYPADESSNTENMISPQFMIASSYGACTSTSMDLTDARNRCATYQEDGYPAGRWRVPTKAEIGYMVNLSDWDIIPTLFSDNVTYQSAQGGVRVSGNGVVNYNGDGVVRCVYDIWYWGTDHNAGSETFTYGDEQRQ